MSGSNWQPIHLAGTVLDGHRHMCGLFDGPEDEYRVMLPFVQEGIERKELAFHIVDPANRASYARRLEQGGIPVAELEKSGQFELRTWSETYLRHGEFDPDAMLALVEEVLQERKPRFPLVRLVAHMNFPNAPQKTWEDWVSYEARLNRMLSKYPDPVVCAYETSKYDGRLVMDLLRTHPVVIVGGLARSNPFFVPPDEFLTGLRDRVVSRTEPAAEPADRQESLDFTEQKPNLELHERVLAIVSHDLRDEFCARIVEELQVGHPGREIRLRLEGDGNGRWDANRLEQVVSNLAANALQYGPEDAPVTIESQGSETQWTLSVHNLGEAIPPEVLPRLFDPFRRGRNADGGHPGRRHLGIGLFIVRELVQAHGGTIEVTSEPAEGTRFVVRLPKS